MIRLKFFDGVLHQSIQMQPSGQWKDYYPVPCEFTAGIPHPKERSLEEKFKDYLINVEPPPLSATTPIPFYIYPKDLERLEEIARKHFKKLYTVS